MMDKHDNSLSALWQSQDVRQPDIVAVKKNWQLLRVKQWSYFTLDLLATLLTPTAIFVYRDELNPIQLAWMWVMVLFAIGFFAYLVWLRRFSLTGKATSLTTTEYVDLVKTQYRQNIKIARVSKASIWLLLGLLAVYFAIVYVGEYVEPQRLLTKLKNAVLLLAIVMPPIWFWAHKREQKFVKALGEFN